jgi:hypothetical protein
MHALVPPILLGVRRFEALRIDAEPHPPHAQLREPPQCAGREGDAVVGAQRLRQPVFVEQPLEHAKASGTSWVPWFGVGVRDVPGLLR